MVCCCNTIGNIFRLIIVGGCVFALTMQWLNLYSCDFFHFANTTESIGIWYESAEDLVDDGNTTCLLEEPFPSEDDSLVSGSRSAFLLSMICGAVAMLLVCIEWICCEICCAGCVEGLAFVGAWGCGLGVYMIYGIEECGTLDDQLSEGNSTIGNIAGGFTPEGIPTGQNCEWGPGATYNLIACAAYFACGILLCFAPSPKPWCKE